MIVFLASHYGNAWRDIRDLYPDAIRCGDQRGEIVRPDGRREQFRVVCHPDQLQGLELSDYRWLSHARLDPMLDALARTLCRRRDPPG